MSATHASPASPAEWQSTPVDGVDVLGALSPSRASDFMTCPLLYRYRTIDRLPEEPSADALRGTLVHKVLEDLFDLPADSRTPDRARDLLVRQRTQLVNAVRGHAAEFGIIAAKGIAQIEPLLKKIAETAMP